MWHTSMLARMAEHDKLLIATALRLVALTDESSCEDAIVWWEEMTNRGGEGMVVKPRSFIARGRQGLLRPAVKCRGPEYLRIIYGPEYLAPEHLELRAVYWSSEFETSPNQPPLSDRRRDFGPGRASPPAGTVDVAVL